MVKTTRSLRPTRTPAPPRRGRPPGPKSTKPAAALAARKTRQPAAAAKPVVGHRKPPAASATPRAGTVPAKRRPGRPRGSTKAASTAPVGKTRRAVAAKPAPAAPKPSKGELQARVEKLERTVATLRIRSREAVRAAKQAAVRINELEMQLAEKPAPEPAAAAPRAITRTPKQTTARSAPKAAKLPRGQRSSPGRDPGDAVRPGVAVDDPEPMDGEATAAYQSLEANLHPADG